MIETADSTAVLSSDGDNKDGKEEAWSIFLFFAVLDLGTFFGFDFDVLDGGSLIDEESFWSLYFLWHDVGVLRCHQGSVNLEYRQFIV